MERTELPEKLFRVIEVAKCLSVSRSAVYAMMDRGELPYIKIGKNRRVRPEAVHAMLAAGAKTGK